MQQLSYDEAHQKLSQKFPVGSCGLEQEHEMCEFQVPWLQPGPPTTTSWDATQVDWDRDSVKWNVIIKLLLMAETIEDYVSSLQ